ncbi:MAG: acyl dehydratase [Halioglobus sp.]|jgi:acyl dehydratase
MNLPDCIGKTTGRGVIHVQRGAVSRFAQGVTDGNPVYHDASAAADAGFDAPVVPPTWTFAAGFQGAYLEEQPDMSDAADTISLASIIAELMKDGGIILHGEQAFDYHQSVMCGDVLHFEGKITDIYSRESKGKVMTFVVTQTQYKSEAGEPLVTETFNLIHRA